MSSVKRELAEHGLVPRKGWGQHFLIDQNILKKIIRTAQVEKEDVVLEIGPGTGQMTEALALNARRVIAVEIDPQLVEVLNEKRKDQPNVEVVQGDILKFDFKHLLNQEGQKIKVVANLPYQISTPLLFRFIDSREMFSTLTLMLQREIAERLVAPPGGKEYGPLSIFVQLLTDVSIEFFIKPTAFFPSPKVESALVHMVWKERPAVEVKDEGWFSQVVRGCFHYRRKMLINGLKHSGLSLPHDLAQRMETIGIDPKRRPETLTIQEFGHLAEAVKS